MDGTFAKIHGEKRCWKMMDTDQGDREYFIKLTFYKDVLLCSGWKKIRTFPCFFDMFMNCLVPITLSLG